MRASLLFIALIFYCRAFYKIVLTAVLVMTLVSMLVPAYAQNQPCSGKKGGISHCASGKFVCNDGSISASKRTCTAPGNQREAQLAEQKASSEATCDCATGTFCTGPRGGVYCYAKSGKKSYVRK